MDRVTKVWDIFDLCGGEKGWVIYHNNQRLRHHKVSVHHGDYFACYERCDSNSPIQGDLPEADLAPESAQDVPTLSQGEAAGSDTPEPLVNDAVNITNSMCSSTPIAQDGDPLLLPGRDGSRHRKSDQQVIFLDMRSFQ